MRSCKLSPCCEAPSDERSAGNLHAAFCGSRVRVTAPATRWSGANYIVVDFDLTGSARDPKQDAERRLAESVTENNDCTPQVRRGEDSERPLVVVSAKAC
jgi:hypothetical protein